MKITIDISPVQSGGFNITVKVGDKPPVDGVAMTMIQAVSKAMVIAKKIIREK
jgi:hypothetical protein